MNDETPCLARFDPRPRVLCERLSSPAAMDQNAEEGGPLVKAPVNPLETETFERAGA
jgi:hypothetical protein